MVSEASPLEAATSTAASSTCLRVSAPLLTPKNSTTVRRARRIRPGSAPASGPDPRLRTLTRQTGACGIEPRHRRHPGGPRRTGRRGVACRAAAPVGRHIGGARGVCRHARRRPRRAAATGRAHPGLHPPRGPAPAASAGHLGPGLPRHRPDAQLGRRGPAPALAELFRALGRRAQLRRPPGPGSGRRTLRQRILRAAARRRRPDHSAEQYRRNAGRRRQPGDRHLGGLQPQHLGRPCPRGGRGRLLGRHADRTGRARPFPSPPDGDRTQGPARADLPALHLQLPDSDRLFYPDGPATRAGPSPGVRRLHALLVPCPRRVHNARRRAALCGPLPVAGTCALRRTPTGDAADRSRGTSGRSSLPMRSAHSGERCTARPGRQARTRPYHHHR